MTNIPGKSTVRHVRIPAVQTFHPSAFKGCNSGAQSQTGGDQGGDR